MNKKIRIFVCYIMLCALLPIHYSYASAPVDRDGDGINIDDIVYYMSQTESLNSDDIRQLLYQIAPINQLTAEEVAEDIDYVSTPTSGELSLALPGVPNGFRISIYSSSDPAIITTDGTITPHASSTSVDLVFSVTRLSDNSIAYTHAITVFVPASDGPLGYIYCADENGTCYFDGAAVVAFGALGIYNYGTFETSTACDNGVFGDPIGGVPKKCYYALVTTTSVVTGITSVAPPTAYDIALVLPSVPTGYTIAISYSSHPAIIAMNAMITPPVSETSVSLIFTVTRASDSSTANTAPITVTVPAQVISPVGVNVAAASNGGTATASSTHEGFPESSAIDGDRRGVNWGNSGGWNDGTGHVYPDWLQVEFSGIQTINEIDVFTLRDDTGNPSEPTIDLTFTQFGIIDFHVQYWNGATWITVTNGEVAGNNKVWRKFNFEPVDTNSIRVTVTNASANHSRIIELEAWTPIVD